MISLILPPKSDLAKCNQMLQVEYGTASNIKSRVNRQSVLAAITSAQQVRCRPRDCRSLGAPCPRRPPHQPSPRPPTRPPAPVPPPQRLKLYNRCPDNGLVVYTGTVLTDEGKERKLNVDFEPFKPINTSLYLCDNKFHTEALQSLLQSDQRYGFLVMDGLGSLFGALTGNTKEVLQRIAVDLPKKHGRGGQSALRFARLRLEKRHNYLRKVAELMVQNFIDPDSSRPNVSGIVLAGSAEFKNDLANSDLFDARLKDIVVAIVDVSYGGDNGFNQAVELASESLANVKFVQERKLINNFFEQISLDSGKFVFGVAETLTVLEMGAVETLIVWEDLATQRYTLRDTSGGIHEKNMTEEQAKDPKHFVNKEDGTNMEIIDQIPLIEWLAENYRKFGCQLEFVTNKSENGSQFCRGFGGIGGILRYQVNLAELEEPEDWESDGEADKDSVEWDSDEDFM